MEEPAAVTEEKKKTKAVEDLFKKAEADKAKLLEELKNLKDDVDYCFEWSSTKPLDPLNNAYDHAFMNRRRSYNRDEPKLKRLIAKFDKEISTRDEQQQK
jgi:hypothetical protein